jgi:hypothetical protein
VRACYFGTRRAGGGGGGGGGGPDASADSPQGEWILSGNVEGVDLTPDPADWLDLAAAPSPGTSVASTVAAVGTRGLRMAQSASGFAARMRPRVMADGDDLCFRIHPQVVATGASNIGSSFNNVAIQAGLAAIYGINDGAAQGYIGGGVQSSGTVASVGSTIGRYAVAGLGAGMGGVTASGTTTGFVAMGMFIDVRIRRVGTAGRVWVRYPGGVWVLGDSVDSSAISLSLGTLHAFIRMSAGAGWLSGCVISAYKHFAGGLPAQYS